MGCKCNILRRILKTINYEIYVCVICGKGYKNPYDEVKEDEEDELIEND